MLKLPDHLHIPGLDKQGLLDYLAGQPDVVAAYLFGSLVTEQARPESDLDLGLLLTAQPETDDLDELMTRLDREMTLANEIEHFVQGRALDLVVLNRAPILLRFQALSTGYLLFENEAYREDRIEFEVMTVKRYLDLQPLRTFFDHVLLQDIKEGRFGERKRHYQRATSTSGR